MIIPVNPIDINVIVFIYRKFIEETLGVEIYFIEEFLSQNRGTINLIKSFPIDEICHPELDVPFMPDEIKPMFYKQVKI